MKVHDNGFIEIKNEKDAVKALVAVQNLKKEIDDLRQEHGIIDLENDAVAYKAAVQNYMIEHELEQIQGDGFHGTLVKGTSSSRWITTDDDLTGDEPNEAAMSLQEIIEKKFKSKISAKGSKARKVWMKITRRIADPEALEEAVNGKTLTVDEIAPAFVQVERKPYLRIFED